MFHLGFWKREFRIVGEGVTFENVKKGKLRDLSVNGTAWWLKTDLEITNFGVESLRHDSPTV